MSSRNVFENSLTSFELCRHSNRELLFILQHLCDIGPIADKWEKQKGKTIIDL